MLLEQHLLQLFGNLPYLSKAEIAKHLEEFELIKATLVSGNWDKAIECREKDGNETKDVDGNKVAMLQFYMFSTNDRVEMRILDYRPWGVKKLIIDFPVESALGNSTEIDEYEDRVICHSENFEQFENRILRTFYKIRLWFYMEISSIEVNLDLGFNLKFLKKLLLEKLESFVLSGDKNNCQIDSKELTNLMGSWKIEGNVQIKTETIGKFVGNSGMLWGNYCEFPDSRWITGDMFINTFHGTGGILKRCLLTSEDFNRFFKQWRNTPKRFYYSLACYLEHKLDVEKVLEGLKAKKWNPKKRGRTYRDYIGNTFTDLADGMDIYSHGELATIHISADKKVIKFFHWSEKFPLQEDKKYFTRSIDKLKLKLEQFVWSPRKLAELTKKVENDEARLQAVKEQIARENQ